MLYSDVVGLHKDKFTLREISLKLNIPRTTMINIINKYKKHNTILRLPGSGRKKCLDDQDVDIILSEIDKNPFTSSEEIINTIQDQTQKIVCSRTVRNYIRTTAFRSRVPRKVPLLSKKY